MIYMTFSYWQALPAKKATRPVGLALEIFCLPGPGNNSPMRAGEWNFTPLSTKCI